MAKKTSSSNIPHAIPRYIYNYILCVYKIRIGRYIYNYIYIYIYICVYLHITGLYTADIGKHLDHPNLQFPWTILTYDLKCKPYHLHSPSYHVDKVSQKLIRPSTLQLAPGFRPRLSFLENELILLWQILQSYNLPMGSQKVGNPSKPFL